MGTLTCIGDFLTGKRSRTNVRRTSQSVFAVCIDRAFAATVIKGTLMVLVTRFFATVVGELIAVTGLVTGFTHEAGVTFRSPTIHVRFLSV